VVSTLPSLVEDFLGRNVQVYELLQVALRRRLVTVAGPSGVGKTALAVAAGRYCQVPVSTYLSVSDLRCAAML
jgi:MoxR-like ATPase